jgi:hypothetical protein
VSASPELRRALGALEEQAGWEGCAHDQSRTPEIAIQLSIAISLKRIADTIAGTDDSIGVGGMLWEALDLLRKN